MGAGRIWRPPDPRIFTWKSSPGGWTRRALEIICEKLGIDPGQTLAFGDQELDLPMIRAAGAGIAMGNAIDRLREEADYVTASNNEGGISQALRHFLPELKLPPA